MLCVVAVVRSAVRNEVSGALSVVYYTSNIFAMVCGFLFLTAAAVCGRRTGTRYLVSLFWHEG